MKNTIKTLTFATVMVLSLSVSATEAFAKDVKHGRETAWTDLEPLPLPAPVEDQLTVPALVADQSTLPIAVEDELPVLAPADELLPLPELADELIHEGVTWE